MSATDDDGEEIPGREIAYRLFAAEYDDASMSYAESDEERAPNYVISPTGARLNRLFAVGTLTEVTSVNEEMVRARVVDPTGAFVVYAGQYQPEALATLEQLEPPAFVAVTGKARTFQPDDSDQVYTSIRPESIATVDAATRDRWVVSAAEQTLERVGTYAAAAETDASGDALTDALGETGVESGLAAGIPLAQGHYGTTPAYLAALRDCALEAVEVVAGDRDQVGPLALSPADSSPEYESTTFASLADLAGIDRSALESLAEPEADAEPAEAAVAAGSETVTETVDADDDSFGTGSAAGTATGTDREAESETVSDVDLEAESSDAGSETTEADDSSGDDAVTTEADSTGSEPSDAEPSASESEETATATADAVSDTADVDEASTAAVDDAPGGDEASDEPESAADDADSDEDELGDFDGDEGGMYEMDEEEREQLEEEFGAEFTTGSEVDDPGEAGIDVPEPEEESAVDDAATESAAASATEDAVGDTDTDDDDLGAPPESGLESETESDSSDGADETDETAADEADDIGDEPTDGVEDHEPAEDVDLESVVIETMEELDDGDGADRSELVETVADDTGVAEADVKDAIQDALMGGQCYEPNDETLKAI